MLLRLDHPTWQQAADMRNLIVWYMYQSETRINAVNERDERVAFETVECL